MTKKALKPADVKRALKETVAKLNTLLKVAAETGLTIVIKPDNTSSRRVSATKSVMVITYPEPVI